MSSNGNGAASYEAFLRGKVIECPSVGFEVEGELHHALFDFQRDIVRWALRRGRAAIFAGTGMGKTPMQLVWAREVCRHTGGDVLVLAPLAVAQQTVREGQKFNIPVHYCRAQDLIKPGINITNYEMLEHFDPAHFAGVVPDECFAAGTLVDTVLGPHKIETIREGDMILNASGLDQVADIHRREVKYAVVVNIEGERITASPNHPFFTIRGWVVAQDLEPGDAVLSTGAAMRMVQDRVFASAIPGLWSGAVLREILLSEMADDQTRTQGEGLLAGEICQDRDEGVGVAAIGYAIGATAHGENRAVESHVRSGGQAKGEPHLETDEACTSRAWGKRAWVNSAAADSIGCIGCEMDGGIRIATRPTDSGLSVSLQAGLGDARAQSLYRGRWAVPSDDHAKNARCEERREVAFARVDSIEILEPGHPELERLRAANGKLYFYDLGATRHPSFSVNGHLVHNSSCIKHYETKTRTALIESFAGTPYRLPCTATPAPNDYTELGNHAEFLGVMTRTEMLSMFFVHDGGETQTWRLKGHARNDFWRWLASWSCMIRMPSDLGYADGEFILPPLNIRQVSVSAEKAADGFLFPMEAQTLQERLVARRSSVTERITACADLVNASDEQWICWCNLNSESDALRRAIPDAVEVAGSDTREHKERTAIDFAEGRIRVLVSKAAIYGFGLNFQGCHNVAFVGLSDSWESYYQAIRRCWRFGQHHPVNVYVITANTEGAVVQNIKRKEADAERMAGELMEHVRDTVRENVRGIMRTTDEYRTETKTGDGWQMYLGDCVEVSRQMADESIDFSVFSPPFSSLYTFSASERDMGNCKGEAEFMQHFAFIVKELHRLTKAGRLVSIHCMDLPMQKARDGNIGLRDFRGMIIRAFEAADFIFHSCVTIWKDPAMQVQRTKALGLLHKQLRKDSTLSRQGIPDFLVTMRKPGENSAQVTHTHESYSVDEWQKIASPVWMDINPSDTLQYRSAREHNDERHIAPLQLEVIRRALRLWSNRDDLVWSPFAGIGSEGYVALQMGRRFVGAELKQSYYRQACLNLGRAREDQGTLILEATA